MIAQQPKLMGCSSAVLREKFTAANVYMKEKEIFQINNLNIHIKELEKEEQINLK